MAAPSRGIHTFVSSLGSGGSARGGMVVRVAIAGVHILIVVCTRLRRSGTDTENNPEMFGHFFGF